MWKLKSPIIKSFSFCSTILLSNSENSWKNWPVVIFSVFGGRYTTQTLNLVLLFDKTQEIYSKDFYLFGVLRHFQHCTGHITTGSLKGRGNQYIQFVRVLYCKLPTNSKQLPAFPLEPVPGIDPQPQRWEARVLPLCHCGPMYSKEVNVSAESNLGPHSCLHSKATPPPDLPLLSIHFDMYPVGVNCFLIAWSFSISQVSTIPIIPKFLSDKWSFMCLFLTDWALK